LLSLLMKSCLSVNIHQITLEVAGSYDILDICLLQRQRKCEL
jgi:hypothetical protein